MELLGQRLKHLRQSRNLKIADASKKVGVTIQAWTDYEKGRTMPQLDKLVRICRYFGVSSDYLIFGREGEFVPPTIADDYSPYLECLVRLLSSGLLRYKGIEGYVGDIVFTSSDDYVKIFALEYNEFAKKNKSNLTNEEFTKMACVLAEKYKVNVE